MDLSFLNKLGLKEVNSGTSTGLNWLEAEQYIESYSPVDGKLIAKIGVTTEAEYEMVIKTA